MKGTSVSRGWKASLSPEIGKSGLKNLPKQILLLLYYLPPRPNSFVESSQIILCFKRYKSCLRWSLSWVSYFYELLYIWNEICFSPFNLTCVILIIRPAKEMRSGSLPPLQFWHPAWGSSLAGYCLLWGCGTWKSLGPLTRATRRSEFLPHQYPRSLPVEPGRREIDGSPFLF